jgi:hypothetical protein
LKSVLVKRPFGVEDNSSSWSMAILMEHLILTGLASFQIRSGMNSVDSRGVANAASAPLHQRASVRSELMDS